MLHVGYLIAPRKIPGIGTKSLGATTPQEADLITLHFTGDSPESLSFKVEGPAAIARRVLAAMTE